MLRPTAYALAVGSALVVLTAAGSACASEPATSASAPVGVAPPGTGLPRRLTVSTGETFYVTRTGNDSAPGSRTEPWRTIQKALNALRPGQRALIRRGTYAQDLVMRRAGTETAPITVAAYPGDRVILRPAARSGDTYPIRFRSGAAYARLQGFVIELARGTSSTNVYFEGSAHHIEVSGNDIRFSQDQGIFAEASTRSLQILGNRIHDNGRGHEAGQHQSHGIYIEGRDHLIANNVIHDHPFGFGIQIYPENQGTIVVNNTIVGSGHSGIVVGGPDGVSNITIRNNVLAYNTNYGVQTDRSCPLGGVFVDTNVLFGNRRGPIERDCSSVNVAGGNILRNPLFIARGRDNLQVRGASPAVDRARADYSPRVDMRGRRRPQGAGYDVGAFERAPGK